MGEAGRPLDLSGNVALTVLLLEDTFWRARVVETITVDRAHAMRAHRSLQTAPIDEFLDEFLPTVRAKLDEDPAVELPGPDERLPDRVELVLPMGSLPKRTMVGFDVSSDLGPVYLVKRRETAIRQGAYLCHLAEKATGAPCTERVQRLLVAMCQFPPGPWQYYRQGRGRFHSIDKRLKRYLSEKLEIPVSAETLSAWKAYADRIGARMVAALGEAPDQDSSSENILLALPLLVADRGAPKITKVDDVTGYLEELDQLLDTVSPHGEVPRFLQVMAEYGRRYDALVSCVINVYSPTSVDMVQDFPLHVGIAGRCEVEVPFADAASNHVAVRVTDPDVELNALEPSTTKGRTLRGQEFNLVRRSKEDFALYGSEKSRIARLRVRFRLTLPWTSRLAMTSFLLLTLAALGLLIFLPVKSSDDLAVFVVPTTLAAGIVLTQQRTSLAMRLQRLLRVTTVIAITVLWTFVVVAYMRGWIVGDRP